MRYYNFKTLALGCWVFIAMMAIAMAQTTNLIPAFDPGSAKFPATKSEFWTWAISFITPVIVWGFGKIPALPRPVLPLLTPFIGVLLGVILKQLTTLNLGWVDMAQAGTVAVMIRESVNQLVTKQMKPLEGSKTDTKPVDGAVATKDPDPTA